MVDLKLLEERGISAEGLKKKLAPDHTGRLANQMYEPTDEGSPVDEKITKWKYRMRLRIQGGRENNIRNHRLFHALDLAWETPFRQVSPTLLASMIDKDPDEKTVRETLSTWGYNLNDVVEEIPDPKTGKNIKRVSIPAFVQIFVPLVRAYVTIRLAKIMNDRRQIPFFKYEPSINTAKNRLRTEALTQRVEMMNQQYDFWSSVKQAVFQMLHYSVCYMFPQEEWHEEAQEVNGEAPDDPRFRRSQDDKRWEHVVREGLRYHTPHPSRTFIDEAHRPSTYNTDSGCEFGGYWRVVRYRDLKNNPKFYNTDRINVGATEWWTSPFATAFFSTVYNSCTVQPPIIPTSQSNDRETKMADNYYTQTMDDISVVYTEYFERLIPSEWGFGDYNYPVWFRFVVAADDTILYAAPLPYCPVIYWGYDADELRAQNASLSLEILPFQDQFSNLMTQYLITVKQNLANAVLYDEDVISDEQARRLTGLGEKLYRVINFFKISGRKMAWAQKNPGEAFRTFRFPMMDSNALIQAMKVILDTLERVLVMSSQEVGQAATHEQTRAEIHQITDQTSTRLAFTATPVDLAMMAMKKQIYRGLMAFGENEFWSQVPLDQSIQREDLDALGFTFDENELSMVKTRRLTVRVPKVALMYESFAGASNNDRMNSVEGGAAMLNALQALLNSQLYPALGPDQFIHLINVAAQMLGFPRDFKLQNVGQGGPQEGQQDPKEQQQAQQEQLSQTIQQMQQKLTQDVARGIKPVMDNQKQMAEEHALLRRQLETILGVIETEHNIRIPTPVG